MLLLEPDINELEKNDQTFNRIRVYVYNFVNHRNQRITLNASMHGWCALADMLNCLSELFATFDRINNSKFFRWNKETKRRSSYLFYIKLPRWMSWLTALNLITSNHESVYIYNNSGNISITKQIAT